ncbi:uncharacterized protein LOC143033653 [Oratosquilla oratoria]|uniref:uncharacterized protein LOC143033653 n=1 Tax=Oratosquilla oratoria TaxID=337810 RepID=UPI003F75FD57
MERFKTNPPVTCSYCKQVGHHISNCRKRLTPSFSNKTPTLVSNIKSDDSKSSIQDTLPKKPVLSSNVEPPSSNHDPCFKPFVSSGTISHGSSSQQYPISILRDTGAKQSLILNSVLQNLGESYTGYDILIEGVGGIVKCPLHNVFLRSDLTTGMVKVAVVDSLPIVGISLLLANDIAGSKVISPLITNNPKTSVEPSDNLQLFPACAVTRSQYKKSEEETYNLESLFSQTDPSSSSPVSLSRAELIKEQKSDPSLKNLYEIVSSPEEVEKMSRGFYIENGVLMRKWRASTATADQPWQVRNQIVLPLGFRNNVLRLAHDTPLAGHLGVRKTLFNITQHFHWPTVVKDVAQYCKTCHTCQLVGKPNQKIVEAPLHPIPVMEEPFKKVLIDCVGPLPPSSKGNQYILTIMCMSTRFPEAIPLKNIKAQNIIREMLKYFTMVGFPKNIQSDQGSNFLSNKFRETLVTLGINHVTSSAYHPQSQGALERFHQTLKTMLRIFCAENTRNWEDGLPFLLFATRITIQESLGFSPSELVFGHEVRGPLKILHEQWMKEEPPVPSLKYVSQVTEKLLEAWKLARENLANAQRVMKGRYDKNSKLRTFSPGDQVLLYLPIPGDPLQAKYKGPYEVLSRASDLNYIIKTPDRRKSSRLCHINTLKPYHSRDPIPACSSTTIESEEPPDNMPNPPEIPLENSQILQNLQIKVGHLSEKQDVAEPLTDLLRKDHDFVWTPTCETAFKNLKSLLTNAPVLRAPDFQRPFLLQVDASDTGIGAALLQEHNEVLHAIAYYSKKLSPAQKNYSVLLERSFSTESEKLSQTVEV